MRRRTIGLFGKIAMGLGVVCAAVGPVRAAEEVNPFREFRVTLAFSETPRARFDNVSNNINPALRWLVVRVDYIPEDAVKARFRSGYLDNVEMTAEVLARSADENKRAVLFTGKVHFWTMPFNGKKRRFLFAVPPQLLDRYMPVNGLRNPANFFARVTLTGPGNIRLARAYSVNKKYKIDPAPAFAQATGAAGKSAALITVENGLFPQPETPWGLVDMDFHDVVRKDPK